MNQHLKIHYQRFLQKRKNIPKTLYGHKHIDLDIVIQELLKQNIEKAVVSFKLDIRQVISPASPIMNLRNGKTPAHGTFPSNIPEQHSGDLNELSVSSRYDLRVSNSSRCRISSSLRFESTAIDDNITTGKNTPTEDLEQAREQALANGLKKIKKPQGQKSRRGRPAAPKSVRTAFSNITRKIKSAQEIREAQRSIAERHKRPQIEQLNKLKALYNTANTRFNFLRKEIRNLKSQNESTKSSTKDAATQTECCEEDKVDEIIQHDDRMEGVTEAQQKSLKLEGLTGALAECRRHAEKLGQDLEKEEIVREEREADISELDAGRMRPVSMPKSATEIAPESFSPEEGEVARCRQSNMELQKMLADAEEISAQLTISLNGLDVEDVEDLRERYRALKEEYSVLVTAYWENFA